MEGLRDDHFKLLMEASMGIIESSDIMISIAKDTKGDGDPIDLEFVYNNASYRDFFGRIREVQPGSKVTFPNEATINTGKALIYYVKSSQQRTLHGPFLITLFGEEEMCYYVECKFMLLGKDSEGYDLYYAEYRDLSVEYYRNKLAKTCLDNPLDVLSERERSILDLLIQNLSTKEIADRENLSTKTVDSHRYNIRTKLGITDRNKTIQQHLRDLSLLSAIP